MDNNCALCKINPAILTASITDKNTGAFLPPLPLCEECFLKVSKTRTTKITESYTSSYIKGTIITANKTTVTSIAAPSNTDTAAFKNFDELGRFCDAMRIVFIFGAIIGAIAAIMGFASGSIPVGSVGVSLFALSVGNTILFYILSKSFEGIADYVRRK